jgi:hypothetical protein
MNMEPNMPGETIDMEEDEEGISDDTILFNVECKKCGRVMPPLTAWEWLNLGKDHPVFQCPHDTGSPSMQYNVRCNRCGKYLPFWVVYAANFPPCHPIHECPHNNRDVEVDGCPHEECMASREDLDD